MGTKKEEEKFEWKSGIEYKNHIEDVFCEGCLVFSALYLLLYIISLFIS